MRRGPTLLLPMLALWLGAAIPSPGSAPYAGPRAGWAEDTLRPITIAHPSTDGARSRALGSSIAGYLSPRGLPPLAGAVLVTDTGLVFRSADGGYAATLPLVGPVRQSATGRWRASAIMLGYVDSALGQAAYVFRVDGGVFETESPGPLLDLARHPAWLDSLGSREWSTERPLVTEPDSNGARLLVDSLMHSGYADTLCALFGRPTRGFGLVGARGRAAGRLGEFVFSRDSFALDPGRITSREQLRHTLAHELAHRWQARSPAVLATLWQRVSPIRDPKRYGHRSRLEQQAEAAAFAIHFLLATAGDADAALGMAALDHYELLVPGTRTLARFFALQPVFAHHPLRAALTTGRPA